MPSSNKDKNDAECCGVGDFPGSPVVKNPLSKAGNMGSNTSQGTKILHAAGQLSPHATVKEAYIQQPTHWNEDWTQPQKNEKKKKKRSFLCFGQDPLCNLQGPVQQENISTLKWLFKNHFFLNLEAEVWDFKREQGNPHKDGQANIW